MAPKAFWSEKTGRQKRLSRRFCLVVVWLLPSIKGEFGFLVLLPVLFLTACNPKDSNSAINGYVEGRFVMIAPKSGGILESLSVKCGDAVKENQALFSLDLTDLTAQKKKCTGRSQTSGGRS